MKQNVKLFFSLLLIFALSLTLLAGCGKKEAEEPLESTSSMEESSEESIVKEESTEPSSESSSESSEESSEESSKPEEAAYDYSKFNPLTGEASEEDISTLRPFACMINNIWLAIPPRGVSHADIIMELMEEGGITRMMAFFMHPEYADNIGSIRSTRIYNIEVARAFDAYLVHCGGSPEASDEILRSGMDDIDQFYGHATGDTFYRDPSRGEHGSEHTLFCYGEALSRNPEELGYRRDHAQDYYGFIFNENAVDQCTAGDANYIYVTYDGGKQTNFQYDASLGGYTAYQYEAEYMDDNQYSITFRNVIVMFVETWLQSDGLHLDMDLSSGYGYYAVDGKYIPINWHKDGTYEMFQFELEDGTPLEMAPGKTFIAVNQFGNLGYVGSVSFE